MFSDFVAQELVDCTWKLLLIVILLQLEISKIFLIVQLKSTVFNH